MLFQTLILTALANFTLALTIAQRETTILARGACTFDSGVCTCPPNTRYQSSIATAIYPVDPSAVTKLTSNFFDATWWGGTLTKQEGNANSPGAKRYFTAMLPGATAGMTVVEELNSLTMSGDGGYTMKVGLTNVPFTYAMAKGTGHVGGTWETISVAKEGKGTKMVFNSHVCFSETDGEFLFPSLFSLCPSFAGVSGLWMWIALMCDFLVRSCEFPEKLHGKRGDAS